MKLLEQLGKRIVFFEGGMGSILQQNGLAPGELPEVWNLQKPDFILNIHRNYLKAGCDIVKTNTFGANSIKLAHSDYTARQLIEQATALAKKTATVLSHSTSVPPASCCVLWATSALQMPTPHLPKWPPSASKPAQTLPSSKQ